MSRNYKSAEFSSSMKNLDRPKKITPEKFPKHTVPNTSLEDSGITFSMEQKGDSSEARSELHVLKSIINRENYLAQLQKVARTVGKKFKPEVADVLDFVRASSLDVIDAILKWRETKRDHNAAFIWNGSNYLLKMPSDLDYLSEYLAIKRWMGFSLVRNPFCVPYPLEEGAAVFIEKLTNPSHLDKGRTTDGFIIGGISQSRLRKKYLISPANTTASRTMSAPVLGPGDAPSSIVGRKPGVEPKPSPYGTVKEGKLGNRASNSGLLTRNMGQISAAAESEAANTAAMLTPQTFIFNDDMSKIRQAELVILKEEEKFGIYMKDPDGKIAPRLQALTRQAAVELRKDDYRAITEPSSTLTYAPHAARSEIGLTEESWTPQDATEEVNSELQQQQAAIKEKYLGEVDDSLKPLRRGQTKVGGVLAPIEQRGVESRPRRPMKTNLAAEIEFRRHREIRSLSQKLEEIRQLKEQIKSEKSRKRGFGDGGVSSEDAEKQRRLDLMRGVAANSLQQTSAAATLGGVGGIKPGLAPLAGSDTLPNYFETRPRVSSSAGAVGSVVSLSATAPLTSASSVAKLRSRVSSKRGSDVSANDVPSPPAASPSLNAASSPSSAGKGRAAKRSSSMRTRSREGGRKGRAKGGDKEGNKDAEGSGVESDSSGNKYTSASEGRETGGEDTEGEEDKSVDSKFSRKSGERGKKKHSLLRRQASSLSAKSGSSSRGSPSSPLTLKAMTSRMTKRFRSRRSSSRRRRAGSDVSSGEDEDGYSSAGSDLLLDEQTRAALGEMERDISLTQAKLEHNVRDETEIQRFRTQERHAKNHEKSRNIERKRRLLTEDEAKRTGPPPEELENVYDYYALRVQATIRGWLCRCWLGWYKAIRAKAGLHLQAAARGWMGRVRVRRIRLRYNSAVIIQKNFRGWNARGTSSALAKSQNLGKCAVAIQRMWRGVLGKRRADSKRALDKAAKLAFECVDDRTLAVDDARELGRRILYAIEEPSTTAYPPDEALHLIRIVTIIIQAPRDYLGLVSYNFFNTREYDEVDGEKLTWLQVAKMVNRSERFIRLVRLMAYGPGAKPPRLVQVPNNANLLFAAQAHNSRWCLQTFENMGMGSKICCQLFKWITSIIEISTRQQEFLGLIASSFPDWLPKLYELQRGARLCEFEIEMYRKCLELINQFRDENMLDDDVLIPILDKEALLVKRMSNDCKGRFKDYLEEVDQLKNDQASREVYALASMEQKVMDSKDELDDLVREFAENFQRSKAGDRAATEALADIRHRLSNQKLKNSELENQKKLLAMQVEGNKLKRTDQARLPDEILFKCLVAGEAKALHLIAVAKTKAMLKNAGYKHAADLPYHLLEIHDQLAKKEEECKVEARRLFLDGENDRKAHDETLSRLLTESELKEQKDKDRFTPTDAELEEERLEDDKEAKRERLKNRQYVPDSVLFSDIPRPRPIILALSRDLPGLVLRKIHYEVARMMPGVFIALDEEKNMGFHVKAMQEILDAGKSIILYVDHGLTRAHRDSFVKNFDTTLQGLIPRPVIVMAVGDEQNRSGINGDFGVDKRNVNILRDGDIKASLEAMASVIHEVARPDIRRLLQEKAAELLPPSDVFVFVCEALYMVLSEELFDRDDSAYKESEHSVYRMPTHASAAGQMGASWRAVRRMLTEPRMMVQRMSSLRRGRSTLRQRTCLAAYVAHAQYWPQHYGQQRATDKSLHLMALFVEQYLRCEQCTHARGGIPLQALTRSCLRGFQSVVTVADGINPEDTLVTDCKDGGWRVASAKLIRGALQDQRVQKIGIKIDGQLHNVSTYRDGGNIYIDAYNPETSDIYMTMVNIDQVPALLMPNAQTISSALVREGSTVPPPLTPREMYLELAKLLRFQQVSKSKTVRKQLVCNRDHTFLRYATMRINGHLVQLKCYEAALGELYLTAYLPEHCAKVTLLVDDVVRHDLLKNADRGATGEHKHVEDRDARPLLPYVLDRLRLSPSRSMLQAKHLDLNDGYRKNRGLKRTIERQGFALSVRVCGGPGRILHRRLDRFLGVMHVVEIRTSGPSKLLMVSLYEPVKRHTMRLRVSSYLRRMLLGIGHGHEIGGSARAVLSDDLQNWYPQLVKRLRIDWTGEHSLYLDRSVYKGVIKVYSRRLILTVLVLDEKEKDPSAADATSGGGVDGVETIEEEGAMVEKRRRRSSAKSVAAVSEVDKDGKGDGKESEDNRRKNGYAEKEEERDTVQSLQLVLQDSWASSTFQTEITREDLLKLLQFVPPTKRIRRAAIVVAGSGDAPSGGTENANRAIVEGISSEVAPRNAAVPTDLLAKPFDQLIGDREGVLVKLSSLLQATLRPIDDSDPTAGYRSYLGPVPLVFARKRRRGTDDDESSVGELSLAESKLSKPGKISKQPHQALDLSLRRSPVLRQRVRDGSLQSVLRARRQVDVLDMDQALNDLAMQREAEAAQRQTFAGIAGRTLKEHLDTIEGADAQEMAIQAGVSGVLQEIVETIRVWHEQRHRTKSSDEMDAHATATATATASVDRRNAIADGEMDEMHSYAMSASVANGAGGTGDVFGEGTETVTDESLLRYQKKRLERSKNEERLVFKGGLKTNYRDGKVRWHGHVSLQVFERPCWMGADGQGKQVRIVVYEPNSADYYEGLIRSKQHLREILGLSGQDLMGEDRSKEMAIFICKYRMDVVRNNKTWDGAEVEEGAPAYRIEFQSERFYSADKVTPINLAEDDDERANETKLIEAESARGKKIVRLVRRVSGLLMQLTVFDLPQSVVQAGFAPLTPATVPAPARTPGGPGSGSGSGFVAAPVDNWSAGPSNEQKVGQQDPAVAGGGAVPMTREVETGPPEGELMADGDKIPRAPGTGPRTAALPDASGRKGESKSEGETEQEGQVGQVENGYAEDRSSTQVLPRFPPPAFRIVGYDPRSRRKAVVVVEPQAVVEVCGGVFSPYLNPDKRRELAKVVCDTLVLVFHSGKPFDLLVPWSGAKKEHITSATVGKDATKLTDRSSAERVMKREGKIFRSVLRVSRYDLLVTVYAAPADQFASAMAKEEALRERGEDHLIQTNPMLRQVIFNFYSPAVSEAAEVAVSAEQQEERLGKPVMHFAEGAVRTAALRRLSRFFRAEIIVDVLDEKIKTLEVDLLPPNKGYVTEYQQVRKPAPGEDLRPVGTPDVFYPLDTCGHILHRRGMTLKCRDSKRSNKDFVVSIYTKSEQEGPERGLVVKLYDRSVCSNAILHVGPSELLRICGFGGDHDLVRDVTYAIEEENGLELDQIEGGFSEFTEKGQLREKVKRLLTRLMDVLLGDLGFFYDSMDLVVPYIKSAARGILPN